MMGADLIDGYLVIPRDKTPDFAKTRDILDTMSDLTIQQCQADSLNIDFADYIRSFDANRARQLAEQASRT
jgi:hypothetical protein